MLKLNRSSFYKWVNTHENRRLKICSDALIGARIKAIFHDARNLLMVDRAEVRIVVEACSDAFSPIKPVRLIKDGLDSCTNKGLGPYL